MSVKRLYIDLDTLFDTRLGVLAHLDEKAAERLVEQDAYWDREHTDWWRLTDEAITNEQFEEAWVSRGKPQLQASYVSAIIPVLVQMLVDYQKAQEEGVVSEEMGLEINVHPYDFTAEEMDELTAILRTYITHAEQTITFIDVSLEEMTPEFIKQRYSGMVFFEFHRWIKLHAERIVHTKARDLPIVVPKLFEVDPRELPVEKKKEELICFKLWLLDHLHLEFIDARWFSMLRPQLDNNPEESPHAPPSP